MKAAVLVVVLGLVLAGSAGCSRQPEQKPATPAPAAAQAPAQPAAGTAPAPEGGVRTVTGTVVETMDASNYTYVRVKTESGDVWAATAQTRLATGDRVTVPLELEQRDFHSKALNRDFPVIYFASHITRAGETAGGDGPGGTPVPMAIGHAPMGANPSAPKAGAVTEPIAQPAGALNVARVWAERKSLAGRTVTVRGKVVKYNGSILDRNWVHIQDGSGKADEGTNDLCVTTKDVTRVGDVVTFTGRVAIDKDFTAGYAYKVMLEGAALK